MPLFATPSMSLAIPEAWQDMSTYILAAPPITGFTPTVTVNVNPRVADAYLERNVLIQTQEMEKTLPGFRLIQREPAFPTPYGQMARLEFHWQSGEAGQWLHQMQMYVQAGNTLYTLTATAPLSLFGLLRASFEEVFRSFRPAAGVAPRGSH